jgi:hypothetical protein
VGILYDPCRGPIITCGFRAHALSRLSASEAHRPLVHFMDRPPSCHILSTRGAGDIVPVWASSPLLRHERHLSTQHSHIAAVRLGSDDAIDPYNPRSAA